MKIIKKFIYYDLKKSEIALEIYDLILLYIIHKTSKASNCAPVPNENG